MSTTDPRPAASGGATDGNSRHDGSGVHSAGSNARPGHIGGATDGELPLSSIHYESSLEPREGLFGATREWLERHSSQPDGDRWRDDPKYLDWAAENMLVDLEPWLVKDSPTPVASQADGELREEIAEALCRHEFGAEFLDEQTAEWQQHLREGADAVLALPAVRRLLAVQEAAVEAIREVHQADGTEPHACDWCGEAWPCTPIRTLDGTERPARAESGSQGDSGRSTYQGGVL